MLRGLGLAGLAVLPLLAGCGQRPLLSVGAQQIRVSPNGEDLTDEQSIPYTLGAPAHVTVTLIQPDGQKLPLRDNDRAAESYALPFTGVVDVPNSADKRVLTNGNYKVVFDAAGPGGRHAEQTVNAVVANADPTPLQVGDIALSLPTFSPNGQGVRELNGQLVDEDQTVFNYSLSKEATVGITVVDSDGNVTPVQAPVITKAGLQQYTWSGKGPNGVALKDGTYTFHIIASDTSGNVTDRTGQVTITGSGTPQVQIVGAKFFPTALGLGGMVQVEVTVKNIGDVAIKTLGPPPGTAYTSKMTYLDPSFNKPGDQSPPYVDTPGRWRIGVQWTSSGQYPARWGFFDDASRDLQPGEQVTVRGSIQILPPQPHDLDFVATIEMGGLGFTGTYGQTRVHVGF